MCTHMGVIIVSQQRGSRKNTDAYAQVLLPKVKFLLPAPILVTDNRRLQSTFMLFDYLKSAHANISITAQWLAICLEQQSHTKSSFQRREPVCQA